MKSLVFVYILSFSIPLWANSEAAGEAVAARMLTEQLQEDGVPESGGASSKTLQSGRLDKDVFPGIVLRILTERPIKRDDFTYTDLLKFANFFARDWRELMWHKKDEKIGDLQVESFNSTLKLSSGGSMKLTLLRYHSDAKATSNMTRSEKILAAQDTYFKMLIQKLPFISGLETDIDAEKKARKQWAEVRAALFSPILEGRYDFLKDYFTEKNAGQIVSGRILAYTFEGIRLYEADERRRIEISRQAAEALAAAVRKIGESVRRLQPQCTGSVCRMDSIEFDMSGNQSQVTELDPVRALTLMTRRYITGDQYLFDRSHGLLESLKVAGLSVHNPNLLMRWSFAAKRKNFESELINLIDALREAYQRVHDLQANDGIDFHLSRGETFFADDLIRRSLESHELDEELIAKHRRLMTARSKELPMKVIHRSLGSCILLLKK